MDGSNEADETTYIKPALQAVERKPCEQYREEFRAIEEVELPQMLGFSARLAMLWNAGNTIPRPAEGQLAAVKVINPKWREGDIKKWFTKDVLPSRVELYNMVKFLVGQLAGEHDVKQWEAFLIYGTPIVQSPLSRSVHPRDHERRALAAEIIATITASRNIPPDAYSAEDVFQRCLEYIEQYSLQPENREVQPGHINMLAERLFDI